MNFAIIAAGEGSRLVADGVESPKPLVELQGVSLIDRLIGIFIRNGASSINIIVNEENKRTISHLNTIKLAVPLRVVVKTTPGSMYSLRELKPFLGNEPFCLSTVDTVFREEEFSDYITAFRTIAQLDGLMAVTNFEDDEKPLYVKVNNNRKILGFYNEKEEENLSGCQFFVSGGIYCLKQAIWPVLEETMATGSMRMRDFQCRMVAAGLNLATFPFSKIVDIDRAADIPIAEQLIIKGKGWVNN
ncbi:MAG: NTP transferase domain-containing protein [Prevotellaceae bacterium]|jgi:NDP-sugar pyrophosphorylase family protein|nr:NTP transferase domain-containing protein [Prevotellaceae bacterium]